MSTGIMGNHSKWGLAALVLGVLSSPQVSAALIGSETITFDDAISGLPYYNFDSNDLDGSTDVVFSTTDPFGFGTFGPGNNQLYIEEPGLEGTTGLDPDLRVDFLQGAVGSISFGFALVEEGEATFTAYDAAGNSVGTSTVSSEFFDLGGGGMSEFPENELLVPLSGTAVYGEFNFSTIIDAPLTEPGGEPAPDSGLEQIAGRYIIDNFTFTPASEEILTEFDGVLPDDPLLPGDIVLGENNVPTFEFDFDIAEDGLGDAFPIFIDPDIAVGYEYTTTSAVASILIPEVLPNGDDTFTLTLPGFGDFTLTAGSAFDLLAIDPNGFTEFVISGIDPSEALDPTDPQVFVTGLTYLSAGNVSVDMTPIIESVGETTVPAPNSLALCGIGLLGFMLHRRKGKLPV